MVELDAKNKVTLQMSCDAFFLLYCGEEPLDDENIPEANEIAAMFPHGFSVEDYEILADDTSLIEAVFIPYVPSAFSPDAYDDITIYHRLEIKYITDTKIIYRLYDTRYGEVTDSIWARGETEVQTNKFGLRFFNTRGGSMFFLKHFKKA